ncbi:MAG: apolipoprotein N-acyltransferase [Bacteroidetes bacterium CG2_30_33_31]|nr:MAG: apolipoprotein N-acyltransferase [Bacteroidetes bacterium CG2_30_33_31]
MNFNIKKYQLILISIFSGLLMAAAWPDYGWSWIIFISWVPMLFVEDYIFQNKTFFSRGAIVLYSYPGFLVWNIITTWWVSNSTMIGGVVAFVLNSLFMALTFGLYHLIRKKVFPQGKGYFVLIALWFSYEYLHMNWEITWSWLVLGNVFASSYKWIQWYEFTGVFGGGLWILLVNILIFNFLSEILNKKITKGKMIFSVVKILSLILLPIVISMFMYNKYQEKGDKAIIVVVQPDIDPFNEEFTTPASDLLNNMLSLARQKVDENTDMIFFPETSIPQNIWESDFGLTYVYDSLELFFKSYNNRFPIVLGMSTQKLFSKTQERDVAAREFPNSEGSFYVSYNTATFVKPGGEISFYHKAKLVPGVERMPYPKLLKPLEKLSIDLGGSSGSLGASKVREVFQWQKVKVGPIICYESIYGEFVAGYVRNGANMLAIITNDGWWGDTQGHKQHYTYARLRAIENRRDIARAANTGNSGFFNQSGDDFLKTEYWVPGVEKKEVYLNDEITFYTKYGDYLARFSMLISAFLILIYLSMILKIKNKP